MFIKICKRNHGTKFEALQMIQMSKVDPFVYVFKEKEPHFKFATYAEPAETKPEDARAVAFFLHDFGVSAKDFGGLVKPLAEDHGIHTYSFDRRGHGASEGEHGVMKIGPVAFRDHWNFFDEVMELGFKEDVPKILISHGLGSLFAAHLCA